MLKTPLRNTATIAVRGAPSFRVKALTQRFSIKSGENIMKIRVYGMPIAATSASAPRSCRICGTQKSPSSMNGMLQISDHTMEFVK